MAAITADLAKVLEKVMRPGDFYVSGVAELLAPSLDVDGVGPIALPLLPIQAEQLIACAEPAPYGRGQETLVDPAVRRTWQITPDRVHIRGRHWQRTLESIVARAAEGLGVDEPVDAQFYKLLVYDRGSFFVSHRDTEKAPRNVRHAGDRAAVAFGWRRTPSSVTPVARLGSTCAARIRPMRHSRRSMPIAFMRCCR